MGAKAIAFVASLLSILILSPLSVIAALSADASFEEVRPLAEKGDPEAQNRLGWMYDQGRGVAQNHAEAVKWFHKAAEQGNAHGQTNLGVMHEQGRGVAQNDAEAVKWYTKAAEQGYAHAQKNIGWMYAHGRGVAQNDAKAVKWYTKSAEQGYADGQVSLGVMYEQGRGVAQNDAEAVKWYTKAAEQGNVHAQKNLGVMYAQGRGVAQNDAEAVMWYTKAAEQGNTIAQNNLGAMYEQGHGVAQSNAEAVKWYTKAAEQGDTFAQNNLKRIEGRSDDVETVTGSSTGAIILAIILFCAACVVAGARKKTTSWGWIIFWFIIFWPVGLLLLFKKISSDKASLFKHGKTVLNISYILIGLGIIVLLGATVGSGGIYAYLWAVVLIGGGTWINTRVANKMKVDGERYKKYIDLIVNQNQTLIDSIAAAVGVSYEAAVKDLQKMIDAGYFKGAYIDVIQRKIVLPSAAPQQQQTFLRQNMIINGQSSFRPAAPKQMKISTCESCGARNRVTVGQIAECEYCGSPLQ